MKKKLRIVSIAIMLFLIPAFIFGQSPPQLGATASYALFTAVGAFDNMGASYITGDVGTNAGAFSGFPPGTFAGQSHVADPSSVQAAIDVDVAYSYLSNVTCGVVLGTTLGNGQVLSPNVYCLGAISSLNGDLILDGLGNPDALFIIKIDGALSTSTHSNVILTNSASLCNVYWQINGAFDLGDSSVFRGTIIANGAITLLEASSLQGRGLSRSGAISLHNNVVSIGMSATASTITAGGAITFCAGNSVTLSGNNGGTWSTGATSASIIVDASADYFVTNSNSCGSVTSNHITVTVSPSPTATITPSGALTFCQGDSITLTANASNSYLWSNGETTQNVVASASRNYNVTITNASGCSGVSSVTSVIVNPLPTAAISPAGTTTLCQGESVLLTANAAHSYVWTNGAITQSITVSAVGNYFLTVTDINGCSDVSPATVVIVNPLPAAIITANGPLTFCNGESVTLTASLASSYLWNTNETTQSIVVSSNGNFVVTVYDANGCSASSATTTVAVNPATTVTITSGSALTFCQGDSVVLTSSISVSYLWSSGETTQSITVHSSGNFSVAAENSCGVNNTSATITVTVNPKPLVTITANGALTFCQGNSVSLTANAANTYLWSNNETTQSISVFTADNYSVTLTDANGCKASSAVITTAVFPLPSAIITPGGATTFCQGNSVTLTSGFANSYLWSNNETTLNITVSTSGNYFVTVTDGNGCSAVSPVEIVTVNPLPAATITANGPIALCPGTSIILTSDLADSYLWNNGETTQSITISNAGNYSVTVIDGNGCTASSLTTAITVNPIQAVSISLVGNCQGNTINLTTEAGTVYNWSNGATSQNNSVTSSGAYTVTVTDANGCSSVSPSKQVFVSVCDSSHFTIYDTIPVYQTIIVTVNDTVPVYVNIMDTNIVTVTNIVIVYDTITVTVNDTIPVYINHYITIFDTIYTTVSDTNFVMITDTNHIIVHDTTFVNVYNHISVTDTLIINLYTGINPSYNLNTLKIYPNPASDHITIDNGDFALISGYSIEITNVLSQTMFQSVINQQQFYIDITSWTGIGIYFVNIYDSQNNLIDVRKLILQ